MNKAFVIDVPVWDSTVIVGCGDPDTKLKALLTKYMDEDVMEDYLETCRGFGVRGCVHRVRPGEPAVLWVPKPPTDPETHGYFAHEIAHVVFSILTHKGMWHTTSSEESYTYLMQYLTKEILIRFKKR